MKKAFTLLEVVISIAIFSLVAVYLYQTIGTMQTSNELNLKRFEKDERAWKIARLFYNDIFSQTDIYANANITQENDFDIFSLKTKNSIHGMINPYVAYFARDDSLFRIESKTPIEIPLTYTAVESVKVDRLMQNITIFRIYENANSYLINYKDENGFASFQISLPERQSSNQAANQTFNGTNQNRRPFRTPLNSNMI